MTVVDNFLAKCKNNFQTEPVKRKLSQAKRVGVGTFGNYSFF